MIAGFLEPDEGEIRFDGRPDRRRAAVAARPRARVPELRALAAPVGLRARGVRPARAARAAGRAARAGGRGAAHGRPRGAGASAPRPALRRPAAAGGAGPHARCCSRARCCSTSRCRTSTRALRAQMRVELRRLHRELGDHDGLRHPRPGGGDGAVHAPGRPRPRRRSCSSARRSTSTAARAPASSPTSWAAPMRCPARSRRAAGRSGWRRAATGGGRGRAPAGGAVLLPRAPGDGAAAAGDAGTRSNRFPARVTSAVFLGGRYDCELVLAGGVTLRAEVPAVAAMAPPPGDSDGGRAAAR